MGLRLRRFRTIFVLLAVAASLPVMVFMGVSLSQSIEREQALLEHDLITKAWLISDDVDEELRAQFDFVRAFADLPALDPPADVDQLTKWMSRAITHEPFWRSANVFDADEKLIFKLGGWGGKQITAVEPESLRRAIQTGKVTLGAGAVGQLGSSDPRSGYTGWQGRLCTIRRSPNIPIGRVTGELAGSKRMDSHDSGCEWCDRRHGRISSDVACGC